MNLLIYVSEVLTMIGALLGDLVGSAYKTEPIKTTEFDFISPTARYTDESVLTIAIANAINRSENYQFNIRRFAKEYADVQGGYGANFKFWLYTGGNEPYNSLGVGPAARVSPIGWAFDSLEVTLAEAEKSVLATHSHNEAIKAARSVAHIIYLGRNGASVGECKMLLSEHYGYAIDFNPDDVRASVVPESAAPVVMPLIFSCAFSARTTEDAIRNAVSLGGQSDTLACLSGAVAEAFFGVPNPLKQELLRRLPEAFLNVMAIFRDQHTTPTLRAG
jgi:ADP-ribosylglycohydrolase